MAQTLQTTLNKINYVTNKTNHKILLDFDAYMHRTDKSDRTRINNLKGMLNFVNWLNNTSLKDIKSENTILDFLVTKIKKDDPEQKWITTYNSYVIILKAFFRWMHNQNKKDIEDWVTPKFARLRKKKSKRLSPYSDNEIWEKNELLSIIKYEPNVRNKAILTMLWDFNARPHEIVKIKIKDIRFRDTYAEGLTSPNTKTGQRQILLRASFPYARDWLNLHPNKNNQNSFFFCSSKTGSQMDADTINWIFKELKKRIERDLKIMEEEERNKIQKLLEFKKWNPYCIRHSAITDDADNLPDNALVKKVGWVLNTKQRGRYIKTRLGDELKNRILSRDGIKTDDSKIVRQVNLICSRCDYINGYDVKICTKCGYPLSQEALYEIKQEEERKINEQIQLLKNENLILKFKDVIENYIEKVLDKAEGLTKLENNELLDYIKSNKTISIKKQKEIFHDSFKYENLDENEKKWINDFIDTKVKEREIDFSYEIEEFEKNRFYIKEKSEKNKVLDKFMESRFYNDNKKMIKEFEVSWIKRYEKYEIIISFNDDRIGLWNPTKESYNEIKINAKQQKMIDELLQPSSDEFDKILKKEHEKLTKEILKDRKMKNNITN